MKINRKTWKFLLGISLSVLTQSAFATVDLTWCDNCTDAQQQARVESIAAFNSANGNYQTRTIYVGNIPANAVNKWTSTYRRVVPTCVAGQTCIAPESTPTVITSESAESVTSQTASVTITTLKSPVESDVQSAFNDLISFYNDAPAGWWKIYYIQIIDPLKPQSESFQKFYKQSKGEYFAPQKIMTLFGERTITPNSSYPDPSINVYDVAQPGPKQNNFLDNVQNSFGAQTYSVFASITHALAYIKLVDADAQAKFASVITFSDGSKVTVYLDTSTSVYKLIIDPTSLRDSHNNNVPLTKAAAAGNYGFTGAGNPTDPAGAANQLNYVGIPVVVNPNRVVAAMACAAGSCYITYITQ